MRERLGWGKRGRRRWFATEEEEAMGFRSAACALELHSEVVQRRALCGQQRAHYHSLTHKLSSVTGTGREMDGSLHGLGHV